MAVLFYGMTFKAFTKMPGLNCFNQNFINHTANRCIQHHRVSDT